MSASVFHFSKAVVIPEPGKVVAGGLDVAISSPPANMRVTRLGRGKVISDSEYRPEDAVTEIIRGNVRYITIDIKESMHRGFDISVANGALWPLYHHRKDIFDMNKFPAEDLNEYYSFADLSAEIGSRYMKPDDIGIVHDYQKTGVGKALVQRGIMNPLGYYHHIPMVDADQIGALDLVDQQVMYELLASLEAYDLVGLQARRDFSALKSILDQSADDVAPLNYQTRTMPSLSGIFGRQTHFGVFPVIGKVHDDRKLAEEWVNRPETWAVKKALGLQKDEMIGIYGGAERLDYTKGHPNKMTAYAIALKKGYITAAYGKYIQIAPISRADVDAYKIEIAKTDQAHNMLTLIFGDVARLRKQEVPRETSLALARQSRIGLIAPLRDGANLEAAQYISAQDPKNPGVLVLSKFAGIAERVEKGVVLVDPLRPDDIARGIQKAKSLTLVERQSMHDIALEGITTHDNADWQRALITETQAAAKKRPVQVVSSPGLA